MTDKCARKGKTDKTVPPYKCNQTHSNNEQIAHNLLFCCWIGVYICFWIESTDFTFLCLVFSTGILMWEVFTGGEMPYGLRKNHQVVEDVTRGYRLHKPPHCAEAIYSIMYICWEHVSCFIQKSVLVFACAFGVCSVWTLSSKWTSVIQFNNLTYPAVNNHKVSPFQEAENRPSFKSLRRDLETIQEAGDCHKQQWGNCWSEVFTTASHSRNELRWRKGTQVRVASRIGRTRWCRVESPQVTRWESRTTQKSFRDKFLNLARWKSSTQGRC